MSLDIDERAIRAYNSIKFIVLKTRLIETTVRFEIIINPLTGELSFH